jgi:hypothetical protein
MPLLRYPLVKWEFVARTTISAWEDLKLFDCDFGSYQRVPHVWEHRYRNPVKSAQRRVSGNPKAERFVLGLGAD